MKGALARYAPKDQAKQIDAPHEPIAFTVSQCNCEELGPAWYEIASVENHEGLHTTEGAMLANHQAPGFRFTSSGLQGTSGLQNAV